MKSIFKLLSICSLFIFATSCIDVGVGNAATAANPYRALNGYVEKNFDRSFDSCWQISEEFVNSIDGKMTYHSKNEGILKVAFAQSGGVATIKIEKITNRATKVSIKASKYGYPRNDLATAYFEPLAEKLQ